MKELNFNMFYFFYHNIYIWTLKCYLMSAERFENEKQSIKQIGKHLLLENEVIISENSDCAQKQKVKKMTKKTNIDLIREVIAKGGEWVRLDLARSIADRTGCSIGTVQGNIAHLIRVKELFKQNKMISTMSYQSKMDEQLDKMFPEETEKKEATVTAVEEEVDTEDKQAIEIISPKAENFMVTKDLQFIDTIGLNDIEIGWKAGYPVMLQGPSGTGKTLAFAFMAKKKKVPIIQINCSENTRDSDFGGMFFDRANETVFQLGGLTGAIDLANKTGELIIIFEEVNALLNNTQKSLNEFLDWTKKWQVHKIGKKFETNEGVKLHIGATCNPLDHGGVYEMNKDFEDRHVLIEVKYPTPEEMKKIIKSQMEIDDKDLDRFLVIWSVCQEIFGTEGCDAPLSPRGIVKFAKLFLHGMKMTKIIDMISYAMKIEQKMTLIQRLRSKGFTGV